MRTQPFVALLGSSGSGKSSLLGAGLILLQGLVADNPAEKSGWLAEDEKAFIAASAALRLRETDEKTASGASGNGCKSACRI